MAIINCEAIKQSFLIKDQTFEILKGITLEINEGEFTVIVGESGSGKSTFLNVLGGLTKPSDGTVVICGEEVTAMNENKLSLFRRKNMGFVFQSYNLLPQLTALENVELPLIFLGLDKKTRLERAAIMLEKVGLKDRLHHKPSELSGGQQQRVSIARALVNMPKVVLADEPTGNLDSKNSEEITKLLKELCEKENITFVVVTHSQLMCEYADTVIKMKDGLLA